MKVFGLRLIRCMLSSSVDPLIVLEDSFLALEYAKSAFQFTVLTEFYVQTINYMLNLFR